MDDLRNKTMNENDFIKEVVRGFYEKAKNDFLIGYHFRVIQNFDHHIPRIIQFWELQLLGKASESLETPFDLINSHSPLGIKRGELGRWLTLFKQTLNDVSLDNQTPQGEALRQKWMKKLDLFEDIFLRSFGLK